MKPPLLEKHDGRLKDFKFSVPSMADHFSATGNPRPHDNERPAASRREGCSLAAGELRAKIGMMLHHTCLTH